MSRRRRRLLLLAAVNAVGLASILLLGGWDMVQLHLGIGLPQRTAPAMLLIAHRGDLERFPEDTLEAIVAATELDVDGIEFDVHESADGTWWVIHDPTLDETTTKSGRVAELSDVSIGRAVIDAGFGFDAERHVEMRLSRLETVLDALDGYEGRLYLDAQHRERGDAGELARLVSGRWEATVICRDVGDARAVKATDAAVETIIRPDRADDDPAIDGWLIESFYEASQGHVEQLGKRVTVFVDEWREDDDETGMIRRAWALNADAYLTKHPNEALEVLRDLRD